MLQAIAELTDEELHAALGRLQAAEFLYEIGIFPDLEYTFKHALTHDVAYGSLLQERRRVLHRQIVEAIERLDPDRLAEQVERLAHHALRGEVWDKAVNYLRQAGDKAIARSANREAVACLEQALRALTHLPETRETREQAIDVRFDLRNALAPLAEFGRIEAYLREAESLAQTLDDQRRLGWVSAYMSSHHLTTGGHATDVRAFAQRVEAIGEGLGESRSRSPPSTTCSWRATSQATIAGPRSLRKLMQSLQGERTRERFGLPCFPRYSPVSIWRAPSPSAACSTRPTRTDTKPSR